ncbi:MAG: type I DNA topoisomerase [Planctomycetes bacterium]|nr:type I DNA topoisomerase [Planctomycetota bacterium]
MVATQKKHLVIVESPGKIRTISKVLGKDFVVKASVGHVRDLPNSKKDDPGPTLVRGVGEDFTPRYVTLARSKKIIEDLRKTAKQSDLIYLCPDPDREGEAIAWHLAQALDLDDDKTFRVTFDEITPRGIKAAFTQPRKIDMDRVNAQQARRVLDRLVGYKLSPLLWEKIGRGLSAGRVQSVAVKLIVEREREIEAFKAEEYWTVGAEFSFSNRTFDADLRGVDGRQVVSSADDLAKFHKQNENLSASGILRTRISSEKEARELANLLEKAKYQVSLYEVKEVSDRPYPPYATSQLQQAAANRLGFDAKRTMRIAQELYQGIELGNEGAVALITYMRTDSFRISQDALTECRDLIGSKFGEKYVPEKPNFYKSRKGTQDAHECIRPTHVEKSPDDVRTFLTTDQFKLYKLIWERFVACQMRPAVFDAATCDIAAQGDAARNAVFRATGRVLKFDGWLAVHGEKAEESAHLDASAADREKGDETTEDDAEEGDAAKGKAKPKKRKTQVLPEMKTGDAPNLKDLEPVQHFTQPPPRYTEAGLVKTLEREGVGRPSTYATIISTIQERGYVEKSGTGGRGAFMPTPLGVQVNDRLEDHFAHSIMDLGFTRKMEEELDKIEEAHLDWKRVLTEFYDPFTTDLTKAAVEMKSTKGQAEKTDVPCPECGTPMDKRFSRYGYYLRCSKSPDCKGTLRLDKDGNVKKKEEPLSTGIKCDLCGSPVVKTVGRFGPYLACTRYAEKQCTFTMKVTKDGLPRRKFDPLPTDVKCEKCQGPMVVRVSARGKTKRAFLSCSRFPKCRGTQPLPETLNALGEQAIAKFDVLRAKDETDTKTMLATLAQLEQVAEPAGVGDAGAE